MTQFDTVFGEDWGDNTGTQYIGDGVYIRDWTDWTGIPSVALRTDRGNGSNVIVLEQKDFNTMVKIGQAAFAYQANLRQFRVDQEEGE